MKDVHFSIEKWTSSTLLQSCNDINQLWLYETMRSITSKQGRLVSGGIPLKHEIVDIKEC